LSKEYKKLCCILLDKKIGKKYVREDGFCGDFKPKQIDKIFEI
jgi:hypothetical protein